MERAEIAEPVELVEKVREAGYEPVSEEELLGIMYGTFPEYMPHEFFRGAERVLDINEEEWGVLGLAYFKVSPPPQLLGHRLRWQLEQAMKRREQTVPLEELTEEEADSEGGGWWGARRDVGNAVYGLQRRWVFEEEGEELIRELEAIAERLTEIVRSVTGHHQRLFHERVPREEEDE
jgi:hypothetical protein